MAKVGFTGTREGMTPAQFKAFGDVWASSGPATEFHHGACVGADAEAVQHIAEMDEDDVTAIHSHECNLKGMVSVDALLLSDVKHPAAPPLERNRDIVRLTDQLIACPKGPEEMRSGTWATIRYARKRLKVITIIWADGRVTFES